MVTMPLCIRMQRGNNERADDIGALFSALLEARTVTRNRFACDYQQLDQVQNGHIINISPKLTCFLF